MNELGVLEILLMIITIVIVIVGILFVVVLAYVIKVLNDIRRISNMVKAGSEIVRDDARELYNKIKTDKSIWKKIGGVVLFALSQVGFLKSIKRAGRKRSKK